MTRVGILGVGAVGARLARQLVSTDVDEVVIRDDSVSRAELVATSLGDAATVDRGDYQQVTRLDYAEPLDVSGSVNVELHWDNTNSARNNRFGTATNLSTTGNL